MGGKERLMARVCPHCKRLTADEELFCLQCGQQTVDPLTWKSMRAAVKTPPMPDRPPAPKQVTQQMSDDWVKMGLGGMLAFFTFFVVYLVVYLAHALY